jgi:hypothetical protein
MLNSIPIEYLAGGLLLACVTGLWLSAERSLRRAREAGSMLVAVILTMKLEIAKLRKELAGRTPQD